MVTAGSIIVTFRSFPRGAVESVLRGRDVGIDALIS